MTRTPPKEDHLPIYEDLVRERGDAVAEAQIAAAHTQHQAAELLSEGGAPYRNQQPADDQRARFQ